jgi:hypothetical protein
MDIDDLLPLPTQPLHVIASTTRDPRLSPSDTATIIEAVNRLRRVAKVTGADLSIVIGPNVAEVLIVGAVPDLIGATREGSHHVEVIDGVRVVWSAS